MGVVHYKSAIFCSSSRSRSHTCTHAHTLAHPCAHSHIKAHALTHICAHTYMHASKQTCTCPVACMRPNMHAWRLTPTEANLACKLVHKLLVCAWLCLLLQGKVSSAGLGYRGSWDDPARWRDHQGSTPEETMNMALRDLLWEQRFEQSQAWLGRAIKGFGVK